jgi:hypothetical protein
LHARPSKALFINSPFLWMPDYVFGLLESMLPSSFSKGTSTHFYST